MKRMPGTKPRFILAYALTILALLLSPLVVYAVVAPFWFGTEEAYVPPPAGYDPTLKDDGVAGPPTVPCTGAAPSLEMNFTRNMGLILQFDNNPTDQRGLIFNNPEKSWDGYTLMSCITGCSHPSKPGKLFGALLIDNNGGFVQGWENLKGFPAKLFPGGIIAGSEPTTSSIESPALLRQDWCGNEVWRFDHRNDMPGTQFHHDYQLEGNPVGYYAPPVSRDETFLPIPNGRVLALANHVPGNAYYYPKGWVPDGHPARNTSNISKYPLVDDAFYMINSKGQIEWQWFACDHFQQMGFSEAAKYGIMNTRAFYPDRTDWTHFNNINWLGPNKWHAAGDNRFNPDNMIFDSRNMDIIAIIAGSDKDGKWKKGDIIWRVGPDYGPGTDWEKLGRIIGPHHAHMIPKTLPGGGNILVFDNGGTSGFGSLREDCPGTFPNVLSNYSRILEFNPETYEVVWEFSQPNPTADRNGDGVIKGNERQFFSPFMSSAQRLVNGNTLIAEANPGRVFEVTKGGEVVFEYYAQGGPDPGYPGPLGTSIYRAYKVPKTWVPKNMTCPE